MKPFLLLCGTILISQIISAQEKLENIYKIELGIQGASIGIEIPIADNLLADVNFGWGGITDFSHGGISYEWSTNSNSFFARGQLRYYLNRKRRAEKRRSLKSNSGTFIAYQTKFCFQGSKYLQVGKNWLNELQFGQQLPLGRHFIFRYYAGVGSGYDIDYKNGAAYPALGFTFGYTL
jgi:hypothetical protein